MSDQPETQTEKIKLNVLGKEYEFESLEQVERMLEEAVQASYLEGQKEALKSVQTQVQAPVQGQTQTQPAPGREVKGTEPVFDRNRFLKLLDEDPVQAWNYMDEVRFGIPAQHVQNVIKGTVQGVVALLQEREVQRFLKMVPDYQPSDKNAEILNEYMTRLGLPFSAEGLRAAYDAALREGRIKPRPRTEPQVQAPPGIPQTWESVARKTGLGMDLAKFASLPAEEQRRILQEASRKARGQA